MESFEDLILVWGTVLDVALCPRDYLGFSFTISLQLHIPSLQIQNTPFPKDMTIKVVTMSLNLDLWILKLLKPAKLNV